jgi:hypothetical protein
VRREPLTAFHEALRFGPGRCPPDLFEGSVPHIVRGLKVHANNISHARHVALEETYPRLLERMGAEAFHRAADDFLGSGAIAGRWLDGIGQGFEEYLEDASHRDLARTEWAWLEAFHAKEAVAITLAELAAMKAEELVNVPLRPHPALRLVRLEQPRSFDWNPPLTGDGDHLLIARPNAEVMLRRIAAAEVDIIAWLERPTAEDELGRNPESLLTLIEAGALCLGEPS